MLVINEMLPEFSCGIFKLNQMSNNISLLVSEITVRYKLHNPSTAYTVAVSGIDAAGKGYTCKLLKDALEQNGYRVALINLDPWQNPISVRLQEQNAAENFYKNVFRWQIFFELLLFPLQKDRKINLETIGIHTYADTYYLLEYDLHNIDIILLEGIFLFKQDYRSYYNLKIWIDCSFETGLARALERNTEQLDKNSLLHDYNTYYYPAQRYHFEKDDPKSLADLVIDNN